MFFSILTIVIFNIHEISLTTLLDHKTTLAYLAYLGYPGESQTEALQVTRPRKIDIRKGKVTRNVFLCYVCGAAGSGKTSLLREFAGKPFNAMYEPTSKPISVVNSVDIVGSEKYLVVRTSTHAYTLEMRLSLVLASGIRFALRGRNTKKLEENHRPARCNCLRA